MKLGAAARPVTWLQRRSCHPLPTHHRDHLARRTTSPPLRRLWQSSLASRQRRKRSSDRQERKTDFERRQCPAAASLAVLRACARKDASHYRSKLVPRTRADCHLAKGRWLILDSRAKRLHPARPTHAAAQAASRSSKGASRLARQRARAGAHPSRRRTDGVAALHLNQASLEGGWPLKAWLLHPVRALRRRYRPADFVDSFPGSGAADVAQTAGWTQAVPPTRGLS